MNRGLIIPDVLRISKKLFYILGILPIFIFGQNKNDVSSLINNEKNAEKKIFLYKEFIDSLNISDVEKGKALSEEGIKFAKKLKDKTSEADLLRLRGNSFYLSGNVDSATVYYFRSLSILEKHKPLLETGKLYNDLGRLYRKTKNYKRALYFYDKGLNIFKKLNNQEGLGIIYNESGVVYEYIGNYDEAINRYEKSLEIQKQRGDLTGQGYALEFIGGALIQEKKYKEAEKYLLESLKIREKTQDDFAIALNYNVLGNLYLEQKKYSVAEKYFSLSNQLATKSKYPDLLLNNYKALSQISKNTKHYEKAFSYLEQSKKLDDSLFNIQKIKQIEELSTQYETQKKDNEILESKSKIFKRNVVVFSLMGILFIGFMFFRIRHHKLKADHQKYILKQQDIAAKAVMEAEDNERKRMALHLHDGVGQLLAATNLNLQVLEELKNDENFFEEVMSKAQNTLKDAMIEVRTLSHQIMPNMLIKHSLPLALKELIEKTNSPKLKINLTIEHLEDKLDESIQVVVFRIIQECINNTIKHADASEINITVLQTMESVSIDFKDNGKGFDPIPKQQYSVEGLGLENMKSRIEFLKGKFYLQSEEGKGTKIEIKIPLFYG